MRPRLPKIKIRNRVLRWFAALLVCIAMAPAIVGAAVVISYPVGFLIYWVLPVPRGNFAEILVCGLITLTLCIIVPLGLRTVVEAVDWLGNDFFDSAAFETERTDAPTTS